MLTLFKNIFACNFFFFLIKWLSYQLEREEYIYEDWNSPDPQTVLGLVQASLAGMPGSSSAVAFAHHTTW